MKRPAALSAGQPPKFWDHRAFHGNLPRPCTDTGQQTVPAWMTAKGSERSSRPALLMGS